MLLDSGLPDSVGLCQFPVFPNGTQLWVFLFWFVFFLSGVPSECCPTGRQSSENRMTEYKRRGGMENEKASEKGVQQ